MIQKCTNPNNIEYHNYGAKGIKVCYRWSNKNPKGFENFYNDVGNPPTNKHALYRINNKGYSPNNWKWSTRRENARNRVNAVCVNYMERKVKLIELSEEYNIPYKILYHRIFRLNWSTEKALTIPVKKYKRKLK